jgi:hypothetical protein
VKNNQQSVLPTSTVGIMLLADEGAPSSGIPTTISFTKKGIRVARGWSGDRQKIINRLKVAIVHLEAEQERINAIIH